MSHPDSPSARLARIESAFAKDGFTIKAHAAKDGSIGALAEHRSARNEVTGQPKRAFFLQGDNYHMGWLMGFLAERDVSRMANEYVDAVAPAFFDADAASAPVLAPLRALIFRILTEAAERTLADIPGEYLEEIDGIVGGCHAANPATRVRRDRLIALNVGIDCVLAHIYSGKLFAEQGFSPRLLRMPVGCNAFILSGAAAGERCLFGRDFMFPTADVFQDTACLALYVPDPLHGMPRNAFVSQAAPGFVGSMTAMNARGVAMGVNMLPSSLCDPARPGLNSLLLTRDCIQYCASADEVVSRIRETRRGVSWLYPVADSAGGGYMIEACRSLAQGEPFPDITSIPLYYRSRLPGLSYIEEKSEKYGTPRRRNGIMARGLDYRYPDDYLADWNEALWAGWRGGKAATFPELLRDFITLAGSLVLAAMSLFCRAGRPRTEKALRDGAFPWDSFGERGFINTKWTGRNCPGPYYFAPQRESRPDVLIATNHCICPEMRMTAMNEWIALLAGANQNDIQWRYDELNRQVLDALEAAPAGISEAAAWQLIDFLHPSGRFPEYYNRGGERPWRRVQVQGSVSLCELRGLAMTSRFGYYGDEPVSLHLGNYLPGR